MRITTEVHEKKLLLVFLSLCNPKTGAWDIGVQVQSAGIFVFVQVVRFYAW
jgi:hypothetical protein